MNVVTWVKNLWMDLYHFVETMIIKATYLCTWSDEINHINSRAAYSKQIVEWHNSI